ncbi:MAG: hypothetical protein IH840_05945 [Candidatus Heimdallarchaeota archaeon]|nr:hypothetical protein [Candidatus Heimdallarchaeota archaeon]
MAERAFTATKEGNFSSTSTDEETRAEEIWVGRTEKEFVVRAIISTVALNKTKRRSIDPTFNSRQNSRLDYNELFTGRPILATIAVQLTDIQKAVAGIQQDSTQLWLEQTLGIWLII